MRGRTGIQTWEDEVKNLLGTTGGYFMTPVDIL